MEKLNDHSKIKDIYANPVGRDVLHKLLMQMNKKDTWITNPFVGNLSLKTLKTITKNKLDDEFYGTFLKLLNSETDVPEKASGEIKHAWWKQAVIYQIYPRSFYDSNGDGIGDLQGIIAKLDYLKELGVDAIWLSPIYDSPNDDNGYDIRDYYAIQQDFGQMEDFDQLLQEVHKRGMRLIMDLVINHTSDEHQWFREAVSEKESKYRDYYIFQKSKDGNPPNNWSSYFSGSAWNYYKNNDEWGLHLFSKKQMDLNWENEELRRDIERMIRWWLKKGVDGFRMDVINYISKEDGLPDGNESIGKMMGYYGIEHYFYGTRLHTYLKELKKEAFEPFSAFTVGETPGVGMEMSKLLTAEYRKELDMVFSFDHLETPGHLRFDDYPYDLNYLKEYMTDYMEHYGSNCTMSLFYENHDNPRMISKVNPNPKYREVLGKLLGLIQLTLRGTPFIYQGQEIGSVNKNFRSISDMRDVESINLYEELKASIDKSSKDKSSMDEVAAFKKVVSGSRDHARTPMQWSSSENAGFSSGTPWSFLDEDYLIWNVDKEIENPDSVWNFYRKLIQLRKNEEVFAYGDFTCLHKKKKDLFTYERRLNNRIYYIECNLCDKEIKRYGNIKGYELVLSNYKDSADQLRPYEANLYRVN